MANDFVVNSLDFPGLMTEAQTLAQRLLPEWDFNQNSDPVRFLVELYLRSIDRANWFTNAVGQEFNLMTALDRRSVVAHAKRLGFIPATRQPATTQVLIKVSASPTPRTILSYAMQVSTPAQQNTPSVVFENSAPITIPGNATQVTAQFVEGQTVNETISLAGQPYEFVRLSRSPVLYEEVLETSIKVLINNVEWTVVRGFGDSEPDSTHVILDIDGDGIGTLKFGNNVRGKIPPAAAQAAVRYRIGGGSLGNVLAGKLTVIKSAPGYVTSVTNTSSASGGVDDQPIYEIKAQAPLYASTGGQLNTLDTIKSFIESTSSVARAKVSRIGNRVIAQIITEQGFNSGLVINAVKTAVQDRMLMGFTLEVIPPSFVEVEVAVRVWAHDNANVADVQNQVTAQINRWLDPLAKDSNGKFINDFGTQLRRSVLLSFLKDIDLIYDYELVTPSANVDISDTDIVTNTHNVTPPPVVDVVGGITTPGYVAPRVGVIS